MKKLFGFQNWSASLKLRLGFALAFFLIISLFLYLRILPCGKVTYNQSWSNNFKFGRGFVNDFHPADRLDETEKDSLKIIAEPIYFSLFSPRLFDKARVKIVYEDNLSAKTPIVEIGLLKDRAASAYEFKPILNKTIEALRFSWQRLIDDDSLIILQKEKNYQKASDFLKDFSEKKLIACQPNSLSCAAFYNYPIIPSFNLPSYTELYPLSIDQDLFGNHKLYVYFNDKKGGVKFDFKVVKDFKNENNLKAEIRIYQNEKLLEKKVSDVPGSLYFSAPSAALYKIEVIVSDNVLIDKIESSSDRLVFSDKLYLAASDKKIDILTNVMSLSASTLGAESLGEINFAGDNFVFNKTHSQFIFKSRQKQLVKEIKQVRGGIVFSGNGVFSFSGAKIFDPEVRPIGNFFVSDNYQYLIANYNSPKIIGNLKESVVEFSLSGADYKDNKYSFVISIPGLNQDKGYDSKAETGNYLAIKEISFEMTGKTLWQIIKELYVN